MDLENVSRLLQPWLWVWEMCASIHRYLCPCGHSQVWNIQNFDILRNCHILKTYRIACKQNTKVLWSGRSMNKIQGSVYDLKYSWCDDHWLVQSSLLQDPPNLNTIIKQHSCKGHSTNTIYSAHWVISENKHNCKMPKDPPQSSNNTTIETT